ncbi:MAG: biotin--[acetyl-CoA-carboxylase] ligase [Armatimonadota bacterium]|nr:biotin--[acetyl-CoA-carboxylase] ligase [Armatimonadota bacterium]
MSGHGRTGIGLGRPLVRLGEATSTNDIGRLLAAVGAAEGATVVADRQVLGRGRLGRSWESPAGGLWCSVLLRPPGSPSLALLSLAASVAVAEAIEAAAGLRATLAWPNDVMVHERKAAGILLEGAADALVVGVGVNVAVPPGALTPDVASRAISLDAASGRPIERDAVLDVLLDRLGRWYAAWLAGDAGVIDVWRERDALAGAPVVVTLPGEVLEGIAEGPDQDGALRVRLRDGRVRRVLAGDVLSAAAVTVRRSR